MKSCCTCLLLAGERKSVEPIVARLDIDRRYETPRKNCYNFSIEE
jgi:hypothetical protein